MMNFLSSLVVSTDTCPFKFKNYFLAFVVNIVYFTCLYELWVNRWTLELTCWTFSFIVMYYVEYKITMYVRIYIFFLNH